jgi:hypothetical protein
VAHIARVVRTLSRYSPSKRLALVLIFLCLLSLNLITLNVVDAAQPCLNSWDITLQGIKSTYGLGETINVTATYSIRNHSLSPGTIQQILVGIVGGNGQVSDVVCIYNGSPNVCPQETTGTTSFVLKCPTNPGPYQILASDYQQYSCEDAKQLFPKNPAFDRIITTIQVSGSSSTSIPSSAPATNSASAITSPLAPSAPKDNQTLDIPSWLQRNQQTIFSAMALIIIVIVGLTYLTKRNRNNSDKIAAILVGTIPLGYLLWIYVITPILDFIRQHWQAIVITAVVLIALAIIARIKGWPGFSKSGVGPTPTLQPPLPGETPFEQYKNSIHKMSGIEFEEYIEKMLKDMGYKDVIRTQATRDDGYDLSAAEISKSGKGIRYLIECKCWNASNVPINVTRVLHDAMIRLKAHRGIVICINRLTKDAQEYADEHDIEFWGIEHLYEFKQQQHY